MDEIVDVVSGSFVGIDHQAAGTATVYLQNGRYVLRFEDDTEIQNGPDLYVWVLPSDSYEEAPQMSTSTWARSPAT